MIAAYPQVPTGYELGVNVAVASYDGKLFFGLIADAEAASDVNRLRDFLYVSFQELSRAARKLGTVRAPALPKRTRLRTKAVPKPTRLARPEPTKPTEPTPPEPEMGSTAQTPPAAVPAAEVTSAA
jgi:hypothetical protein